MNQTSIRLYVFIFLSLFSVAAAARVNELSGIIYDMRTTKPLPNVSIYIEDLKIGAVSDSDGAYAFRNLPEGTYIVAVRSIGYKVEAQSVKIKGLVVKDYNLSITTYEQQEIVITGNSTAANMQSTPQPIIEITNSYLMENASTNIIDALKHIPGVDGITDGQSIAKPVIRGLGYNRVVTVNDGVRQEGQQWGDEFGIEVDPNSVNRVEILKGPASLVYGSDAISGVINFLPEETLPEGQVKGDILVNYQTNNGLIANAAHIAGTLKGISFSARVDNTMAHAYQNQRDGYVFNSQFSNFNTDGTIGIHRKWGFSQLHYSYFELRTGIVEGAKDSTGAFVKQALDGSGNPIDMQATNQELRSYTPFVINQLVKHNKLVWDNSISVGGGRIIARAAWQQNSRQENNDITIPNTSNIWYLLNTYNYDLRYVSPDWNGFNFSAGVNGMYQNSKNKGTLLLIPEYDLFDIGGFAIANKKLGRFDLSGGVRYDVRTFKGHDNYIDSTGKELPSSDPTAIHRFTSYTSNFSGVSASLGATYKVSEKFYLKANAAMGFRAPNVAETGSNGIHDGTVVYEIGQPNLKSEQSTEFDLTPGFRTKDVNVEASIFYNSISNFIYARQLSSAFGGDSVNNATPGFGNAPVFLYSQTNAVLLGGEASVDVHPSGIKWLDWYTGYSYVDARLKNVPDSLNVIPFVPPARLRSEITLSRNNLGRLFRKSYFRFGVDYNFEQDRVYQLSSVYNGNGATKLDVTPAYTLLHAGVGSDIMSHGKKMCAIYINVDNIANLNYIDYMSRFKFFQNAVNGNQQNYVYNMGRNVSIKLLIPLDFSRTSK
jgi:iron complex outermembrane receptor protein